MQDEGVKEFLDRSHSRVLEHCDALLARSLMDDDQRSRLLAFRATAEADLRSWKKSRFFSH